MALWRPGFPKSKGIPRSRARGAGSAASSASAMSTIMFPSSGAQLTVEEWHRGRMPRGALMSSNEPRIPLGDHADQRPVATGATSTERNAVVQLDPDHPGFRD